MIVIADTTGQCNVNEMLLLKTRSVTNNVNLQGVV